MKEITVNSLYKAKYGIYIDGAPTDATGAVKLSAYRDNLTIFSEQTVTRDALGKYSYILPPHAIINTVDTPITTTEGILKLVWHFTLNTYDMSVVEEYSIVTAYARWEDFQATAAYADFLETERVVRFVIHSYCGQTFGQQKTVYAVEGHGENSLSLPRRLISLDSVKFLQNPIPRPGEMIGFVMNMPWEITADGWVIRQQPQMNNLDPVLDPPARFQRNMKYNVTGTWGYEGVPTAVEDAAKILVADYLCPDSKYVSRYIKDVKMSDWELEFADGAFKGTGNSIADSLLLDYRLDPGVGMI